MTVQEVKKQILPILKRQKVIKAAIFGSIARNETKRRSDLDLLVKLPKDASLLDLIGLKLDLEEKLSKQVDLVEYGALHPLLKEKILREQISIL